MYGFFITDSWCYEPSFETHFWKNFEIVRFRLVQTYQKINKYSRLEIGNLIKAIKTFLAIKTKNATGKRKTNTSKGTSKETNQPINSSMIPWQVGSLESCLALR